MLKAKLIVMAIKAFFIIAALGLGIWYLSSSLGGTSITYTSLDNFLTAVGATDGNISNVNGCFMCRYISDLFTVIGNAADKFWNLMVNNIWILMVLGFGLFIVISIVQHMLNSAKEAMKLDDTEKKLEINALVDKIWKQGARVLIVGAVMGMLGMGGTGALKTVSQLTITPVMYLGAELSMAATGISDSAQCNLRNDKYSENENDILNPILQPFMCVVGNINSVMLAGAAGGFSLMNYSWMGMGGGAFTWVAGLALVLMFLLIGFDLFFQILSVVFKLVFLVIFLPLLLASYAFEGVWAKANGLLGNAINMLVTSAVRIIAITLKTLVIYATVSYTADAFFPGPNDGYTAILPPMMGMHAENPDAQTLSVMNVFTTCEQVALVDGEMDKDKFKNCFTARKAEVERKYPNAFNFMDDGWDFLLMMACLFFLYFYAISPKIDKMLGKDSPELFDFGKWTGDLIKTTGRAPLKITDTIADVVTNK